MMSDEARPQQGIRKSAVLNCGTMLSRVLPSILILLQGSFALAEKTTREIFEQNKGAVVLLLAYDSHGLPSALGSGFYFESNRIASNFHVVERASRVAFRVIGSKDLHDVKKIASVSKSLDLAVLEVDQKQAPARIASGEKFGVGDKVVAIGNPRGLEGTVSEGIISAVRDSGKIKMLQITAPISPGSSGGPLFNTDGEVVGVTTSTLRDSQNLNFAVPASLMLDLHKKGKAWEPMVGKDLIPPDKSGSGVLLVSPEFTIPGSSYAFAYSLRNATGRPIRNISYLLVFKIKKTGEVIHFVEETLKDTIPPGLTKRFSRLDADLHSLKPQPEVEFRVLNFDFVGEVGERN